MKIFEVKSKAGGGEFVLGVKQTGTHACYMIYGELAPGEGGRLIKPGEGHEEILLAVKGELTVSGSMNGTLREGTAFHIAGESECFLENRSSVKAIYVAAGGHPPKGKH